MQDEHVRRHNPAIRRQGRAELGLHLLGRRSLRDAEPVGDAEDMAVDREAGHAERMAKDDVGRLAPDAGKGSQSGHGGGHLAVVLGHERLRKALDGLRLHAEEAGGLELRFELRRARGSQRACIGIAREERGRDLVHALVRRLRRQHRCHEELERRPEIELGEGVRMLRRKQVQDLARLARRAWRSDTRGCPRGVASDAGSRASLPRGPGLGRGGC